MKVHTNTELLKEKISKSGLKQYEIAQKLNMHSVKITNFLNKILYPRLSEIYLLSIILDLSDEDIVKIFFSDLEKEDLND